MKVVGHNLGRLIVLFPREEIRPVRGTSTAETFTAIRERYDFLRAPDLSKPISELDQQGYQFLDGKFADRNGNIVIEEFTIYNDGISVSSYVTDTAESFFLDFMAWAREEFQVRPFSHEPKRIYRSQLTVHFAKPLANILKGFDGFFNLLSAALETYTGTSSPVDLVRFGVGVDEAKSEGVGYAPFSVERRIQIPFEEEWYFSDAPLPSNVHVELLEELERRMLTDG